MQKIKIVSIQILKASNKINTKTRLKATKHNTPVKHPAQMANY